MMWWQKVMLAALIALGCNGVCWATVLPAGDEFREELCWSQLNETHDEDNMVTVTLYSEQGSSPTMGRVEALVDGAFRSWSWDRIKEENGLMGNRLDIMAYVDKYRVWIVTEKGSLMTANLLNLQTLRFERKVVGIGIMLSPDRERIAYVERLGGWRDGRLGAVMVEDTMVFPHVVAPVAGENGKRDFPTEFIDHNETRTLTLIEDIGWTDTDAIEFGVFEELHMRRATEVDGL